MLFFILSRLGYAIALTTDYDNVDMQLFSLGLISVIVILSYNSCSLCSGLDILGPLFTLSGTY